jgi:hypothetical protein
MSHDLQGSSDLDLAILVHLRGYPEELRRFSNLMKQARSNGRTAADFFLSRPVAEDSFVAAVCRLVKAGEDIVTVVEAAEMLRIPPSRILELAAAPGFPPPVWGDGRHRVWLRADIPVAPRAADDPPHRAS